MPPVSKANWTSKIELAVGDCEERVVKLAAHEQFAWFFRHAGIAVGSRRHDPLEQAENAAHLRLAVEGRDEMHL